ncbi:hypothetical protein GCM10011571_07790 [Marinithermofilum abyssi]|uniref:Uncharacterized protein n=1 Tax=Marinithermofilum abyssi TaxID=1571185 RepID=A0A8J2VEL1_9BACL|nr:hypothetical protein [Marinithermofilum abyssi]GGE08925.1 hypothetical protein GCM10011571_07790 [Marinithermofilum abyssi]
MSTDYRQRIEEIIDAADGEESDRAVAALEEAVRLADVHQDIEWGFKARESLVQVANFSGHGDKSLVAFSWILAQIDKNPEYEDRYLRYDLMWRYKWIASSLTNFPHISKEQILNVVEDMERRYKERGLSMRAVERIRYSLAKEFGWEDKVEEHFERWQSLPQDGSQDCEACETDFIMDHYLFHRNDLDQALEIARPILEGRLSCIGVPGNTLTTLMMELFEAGRVEEADRMQRKSHRYATKNADRLWAAGKHIQFLTLTDQLPRAIRIFEKMASAAVKSRELSNRHTFIRGARTLFLRMADRGRKKVKLRLATDFPVACDEPYRYDVQALGDWFSWEAERVADLFDARNGTSDYHDELKEDLELMKKIQPLPRKAKVE